MDRVESADIVEREKKIMESFYYLQTYDRRSAYRIRSGFEETIGRPFFDKTAAPPKSS